jgi:hypothetical protein
MSKRIATGVSMALVAALVLTLLAALPAFAEEAAPATTIAATATAAPAEGAATEGESKGEAAAEGAEGEKSEMDFKVGNLTEQQKADLKFAWAGTPGYDILIVSIIGMVLTVGIIGFAIVKQRSV